MALLRGELIVAFQYLKRVCKYEGNQLFTQRLPREAVDAPSLEEFKVRLDGALGNLA